MMNSGGQKSEVRRQTCLNISALVSPLFSVLCILLMLPYPALASWDAETVLKAYLRDNYPWAEVDVVDVQLNAAQPAEAPVSIAVEKSPPGKSVFRFEFRKGNSITVTALVKAFDRVIRSRAAFGKGHVLRQEDVYPTLMATDRIPKGALREEAAVIGQPLLRSVVSNAPLTDAMLSNASLIKRGRRVAISVETPTLVIRAAGEMRQDAVIGDYVKVLNLQSHKILIGQLMDENTVRVEF